MLNFKTWLSEHDGHGKEDNLRVIGIEHPSLDKFTNACKGVIEKPHMAVVWKG